MKELADGYYWFLSHNDFIPEIVYVCNNYSFRRKIVPMVIGNHWKDPLSNPNFDKSLWVGPIDIPEAMASTAAERRKRAGV